VREFDQTTRTSNSLADQIALRAQKRRGQRIQLLGGALIGYGIIGIAIFAIVAVAINKPLERIRELTQSVEEQRTELVASMVQGETTIRQMAMGVRRMDTSLGDAHAATDRSSGIALAVATSMFQLRDAMSLEIPLVGQPLLGLSTGFDQAGTQLQLLSQDLSTIGSSLDTNRTDVSTTATNLERLAATIATLTESVRTGPAVGISEEALDSFRLAIFAVAGWLLLFAVGCAAVGIYLVVVGRREARSLLVDR
jgi:hypothetical protein